MGHYWMWLLNHCQCIVRSSGSQNVIITCTQVSVVAFLSQWSPFSYSSLRKKGKVEKQLIYFLHEINDLAEIGMTSLRIPKSQLQAEEIDWAGFLDAKESYPKMSQWQMLILDRHLNK